MSPPESPGETAADAEQSRPGKKLKDSKTKPSPKKGKKAKPERTPLKYPKPGPTDSIKMKDLSDEQIMFGAFNGVLEIPPNSKHKKSRYAVNHTFYPKMPQGLWMKVDLQVCIVDSKKEAIEIYDEICSCLISKVLNCGKS
jgi:hypothetical protein